MSIHYYFLLSLFCIFLSFVNTRISVSIFIFLFAFLILNLSSTGMDYDYYEKDYLTGYFKSSWPFFYTNGGLTAEPFYRVYSGFIRVITQSSFQVFLVVNFLLCIFIYFQSAPFNNKRIKVLPLLFSIPVIIPTIFYFSPRSSLSYFLVLSGFFTLIKGRRFFSFILMFLGGMIHSQFLLFVLFIFVCVYMNPKGRYGFLAVYLMFLFAFLKGLPLIINFVTSFLSFLPSADVATSKTHYIESAKEGFRITSILSIFVFPLLSIFLFAKRDVISVRFGIKSDMVSNFLYFTVLSVFFSFIVNLVFMSQPHLAGRLSRFSDYYSFMVLLPFAVLSYFEHSVVKAILLAFLFASPLLFPTIYSVG